MTVQDQRSLDFGGILARVKAILLSPAATWDRIAPEPATIGGLYTGYILILAAVGPVCHAFGWLVFGYGNWMVNFHPTVTAALSQAIVSYLISLGLVFVTALIIDALAPSFGATKSRIQAFKVATYSLTAFWAAGVFGLLPALWSLGLLGFYSVYLLYLGLPRLMQAPLDRAAAYTLAVAGAVIVLLVIVVALAVPMVGLNMIASMRHGDTVAGATGGGTIEINGEKIDLAKLQGAANQLGSIAKQFQQAADDPKAATAPAVPPVAVGALKALLPDSLAGGYKRMESESNGAFGTVVVAEATYAKDNKSIKLSVTDLASAGAFAQLVAAFGIESDKETANGFEKIGRVDGVLTVQQWDRAASSGKYSVLLADRFIIDAEGQAASFDDLKAAVAAVGPDRVLRLK